jgi:AcrR family transcriptional regulator
VTSSPRRTGPRSDVDVPALVVDTAERLFGLHGVEAVSLRRLARETGVAPTAVAYHFGDKDGLIAAVLNRRGRHLSPAVRIRLGELAEAPVTPTPRQLIDAMMVPYVEMIAADPAGAVAWLKLVHGLATSAHPIWGRVVSSDTQLIPLFLAAFRRVFPDLSVDENSTLLSLALYSMIGALAGSDLDGFGAPLGAAGLDPDFVDRLAAFTAGGLSGFGGG